MKELTKEYIKSKGECIFITSWHRFTMEEVEKIVEHYEITGTDPAKELIFSYCWHSYGSDLHHSETDIEVIKVILDGDNFFQYSEDEYKEIYKYMDYQTAPYKPKRKTNTNDLINIYLMLDERTGFHKIGKTKRKPEFREKTLQSDNPLIKLIFSGKSPSYLEKDLHKIFKQKLVRGEWFDLSEYEVKKAIEIIEASAIPEAL